MLTTSLQRQQLDALIDAGLRLQQEGDYSAAAGWYERALALEPTNFDTLQLLGLLRVQTGDLDGGIVLLQQSLAAQPRQFATLNNLAGALRCAGRLAEAIETFRRALELDPTHPVLLTNLGSALLESDELHEAATCFSRALERDGRNPEIYFWVGNLYRRLRRPAQAAEQFRHALRLSPKLDKALNALATSLEEAADDVGALAALRVVEAHTGTFAARVFRANAALRLADWRDWASDAAAIAAASSEIPPEGLGDPLRLMGLPATGELLRKAAERVLPQTASTPMVGRPQIPRARTRDRRIRVAYLSPDFRYHALGNIVAEVFELRDTSRFEVFAYAWGPADDLVVRPRIVKACEQFLDVEDSSIDAVAERLRADGIDIAVDLSGHTALNRFPIFAARPAPLQVSWLGYPGTTGASYIDYLVADRFTVPQGAERDFTEHVIRLPHTYLPFDRTRVASEPRPRAEYGLAPDTLVLGCFCQTRKLNPLIFDIWMEALRAAPRAVLWLSVEHPVAIVNVRREASERGVSSDRIVFACSVPNAGEYLARYRVMDLALDTYPYGSHSTAMDVLWAGCPLISVVGDTFASRVSGSVLHAAGFPELVTCTPDEYRKRLLALVENPQALASMRARVEAARSQCPVFDMPRFVRALEDAYLQMWSRHQRGEPPASFSVPALREGPTASLELARVDSKGLR